MRRVNYCVCCDSKKISTKPARMVRFLVDRMTGQVDTPTDASSITCEDCGLVFSDVRFDLHEELRFYQNYMTGEYLDQRASYDEGPGIISYVNSIYNNPEHDILRRQAIVSCVKQVMPLEEVKSLLDYGGHTGNTIPLEFDSADRYVFDVEPRTLANGLRAITNSSEIQPVDLILCCHTLEHVSYPLRLMDEMKRCIRSGSWIYCEVPLENPDHPEWHEHINRFNPSSLHRLMTLAGMKDIQLFDLPYPRLVCRSIAAMGRMA